MNICTVDKCNEPAHSGAGWTICSHHGERLAILLGDVPAVVEELETSLSRQTASGTSSGSRGSEKPLPFDVGASEALAVLGSTLRAWALEFDAEARPMVIVGYSRWLLHHVDRMRCYVIACDAFDEIEAAVGACWRAVDRRASRIYLGQCYAEGCPSHVWAPAGRTTGTCAECATVHAVEDRRDQMLEALHDRELSMAQIATVLVYLDYDRERMRKLLNKWAERKVIVPVGVDAQGRETYRFGDVREELLGRAVRTNERIGA